MKRTISRLIEAVALMTLAVLLSALIVIAQTNSGSISGAVRDQSGAVIPNATVRIVNMGTNAAVTVQTDSEGRYQAPVLPTGRYQIEASGSGFKTRRISEINLAVGERARVDVTLSVGEVGETVTVVDQTRTDSQTTTIGDTINSARVADLPVNGRDFTLLLATVPGSVQSGNFFQTSLNGVPTSYGQSVLVDGIDAGRADLNGTSNVLGRIDARVNRISLDSVQEVQVLEQTYSAQYGQAIGAIINPITKSGSNEFHGGAFEYFRNDALDATDFFSNAFGLGKEKFRMNQFGANLSGPVVRDRLFFFTNYEGVRQSRGALLRGFTPTAAFRAEFDPALAPALATLPAPNTNVFQNVDADPLQELGLYTTQKARELREDTGSIKLDYKRGDNDQYSLRYNINDSNTITPYGVGSDQVAPGSLRVQLFKLSQTHTFSGSAVNEFAFGVNRNVTYPRGGPSALPRFNFLFVDSAIAGPGPAQFSQFRAAAISQFLDTFSFIRGAHALKAGTDIRLNRRAARSDRQDTLIFFGVNDFANNAPFIAQRAGNPTLGFRNENYSFFIQDDWKARPGLTVNLGLRYEVSSVSREQYGRLQNFDLATLSFTPPGQKIHNADKNNFGPRVGFAWDVFGGGGTVARGGFGIFFNQDLPASFGSPQANTFPQLTVNVFDAFFGGFPLSYPLVDAVFTAAPPSARSAYAIERNLPTSYAQQWSLNLQQDVRIGVLQIGYVGNHALKLLTNGVVTPRNANPVIDASTGARRLPGVGDVFAVGAYPQSNYNALQMTFKRNLARGMRFNVNYTWSHEIDDVIGFFKDYQDGNNMRADRASGDQDIRHNFTFDFGYDILSLKNVFSALPKWLADGYQINSITQIRTGFPVNVTVNGGLFGGSRRPNLVPGVGARPSDYRLPDRQFNPAAFSDPGAGKFGNLGRNALRGSGFAQADFSVFKTTRLSERLTLQLRAEVFNIFNHTNFADPSGGLNRDTLTNTLAPTALFGQSVETVGNQLGGLLGAGGPRQMQIAARFIF
jgi:hypothetical protein